MNPVHFRTLDLNLLQLLDVLIDERSVTRAGDRLSLKCAQGWSRTDGARIRDRAPKELPSA